MQGCVNRIIFVPLTLGTSLATKVLTRVGGWIRVVTTSLADGTVGEGVMVGWGGGVVSVEAASRAGGAGGRGGNSGVGAFWASRTGGFARCCR